jgi:hypothetical protein
MTLRVSRSLLEAALLNMMNEADPKPAEPSGEAPPAAPAPVAQPAPPPPPEDKTGRAAFEAKLKELEAVPDGKTYAVGNDTFEKKSGNWYLAQVEGVQGFDDKSLLTLVNDSAKEDIAAKIEKDKKSGYSLGVTIRGDQFAGGGADKSATFSHDKTGLYKDLTLIPAEIVAQYWFEEVQGETDMGAIAASIIGASGVQVQAFVVDELAYVLDGSDLYIVWTGNQDNPLLATHNLLESVDPAGRIGGTNRILKEAKLREAPAEAPADVAVASAADARKGANPPKPGFFRSTKAAIGKGIDAVGDAAKYTSMEKDTTTLKSYRDYLNTDDNQRTLGMRINDLRGLGDLRDKISQSRSLAGKFFDLFNADDIKMRFVITQWGPAFVREQMFGTRGGSNVRGGLSPADMQAFGDTGLFREMTLRKMNQTAEYIAKAGLKSSYIASPAQDAPVKLDYIDVRSGFEVTGIQDVIVVKKDSGFEEVFENKFSDAFFLYFPPGQSNKIIDLKGAPPPAPEATASATPEPLPDPWKDYNEEVKRALGGGYAELGDGYFTFPFNRSDNPTPVEEDYLTKVYRAMADITDKIPKEVKDFTKAKKFQIFFIGTADPVGGNKENADLSTARVKTFTDKITNLKTVDDQFKKLNVKATDDTNLAKVTTLSLGEEPWKEKDSTWGAANRSVYTDAERAPLRIAKLFIGPFDGDETAAKAEISKLLMDKAKTLPDLRESVDLDPLRRQIRKILLETMRR